ncbi:hypothetical protein GGI07_001792 [Coemansia sp. Benny D115]|nr:hypothetical protein GGI07_001792 [Coemansia sp. Benny D115]
MGSFRDALTASDQEWIKKQPMYFVSTAPLAKDGHINCSPKGYDGLCILDSNRILLLDGRGSGCETIAHAQQNGRITIMFCSFDNTPRIMRVFGTATVHEPGSEQFAKLFAEHYADKWSDEEKRKFVRTIIDVKVHRVGQSCGYSVPVMELQKERKTLIDYYKTKSDEVLKEKCIKDNSWSIDGIPSMLQGTAGSSRMYMARYWAARGLEAAAPWIGGAVLGAAVALGVAKSYFKASTPPLAIAPTPKQHHEPLHGESQRAAEQLRRRKPAKPEHTEAAEAASRHGAKSRRPGMPYLQAQVVHHRPRVSVLDKELTTVSYHGFVNFLLLLLSATLIRLAIENYLKYGILVSIPGASVQPRDWVAALAGVCAVGASFFAALAIELQAVPLKPGSAVSSSGRAAAVGVQLGREKVTVALHLANLCFVLIAPSCITYFAIFQPALGTLVMTLACVMFLKLYSLAATNFDLRRAYCLGDSGLCGDPLRFASIEGGRFVLDPPATAAAAAAATLPQDKARDSAQSPQAAHASSPQDSPTTTVGSSQELVGIDAEVAETEDLVHRVRAPLQGTQNAAFSLNARALADSQVGGDDRIDAKADALPRPRLRRRAATSAANVLQLVADTTGIPRGHRRNNSASSSSSARAQFAARAADQEQSSAAGTLRDRIFYRVAYPANVTLRNFGYFWLAPTLCYQPSYPRIAGPISKSFLAKRVAELIIICITMYVVIQQYAVPTLVGSVQAIDTRNGFWLSERVLKLSVISAIVWFLGFYAIFHAGLNALAEALRFADRAFYLDWWNSVDLAAYWREWNLPIHYFCKRHIMVPLVSAPLRLPVNVGVTVTFLVSAIMHELLFGVPTHCLKGYSFVGMMAQIPLIQLTQWLVRWRGQDSGLGNAVFWISFCIVGQPLGVVQYYYTWVKNNP